MNMITNAPINMTINDISLPIFTGIVKPAWVSAAEAKGFNFVARVVNRLHFALQCKSCGALSKVNRHTLMTAQPLCHACIERNRTADANAAGLEFLGSDKTNRHYGVYRLPCGHETRRQFELIKRAVAGETGIRCESCLAATEAKEAAARGWELIGPDPDANPSYRHYRHSGCGHEQRIARANMQSGRFGCGGCGVEWPAAPSYLYAMTFTLSSGRELVKLGFSRDPESRLRYQLQRDPGMSCAILHAVAVPTGKEAIVIEKRLHAQLRLEFSDCVVDPAVYRSQIRVKSEIYDARLTHTILDYLGEVEDALGRHCA